MNILYRHLISLFFISAGLGFSFNVIADEWQDNIEVDGFYSLDISVANLKNEAAAMQGPLGTLQDDKISLKSSLLGAQVTYQMSDNLTAYVQGSLSYTENQKTEATLDWAYVSYDLGQDWSARLGKFQIPFLQGTELKKIGFSRLWARPLTPGSGASGFNEYKGAELVKKINSGKSFWEFQVALGEAKHNLNEIDNKNLKLISGRYQTDEFWIRSAVMQADYSVYTPSNILISDTGSVVMGSVESEVNFNNWLINLGFSTSSADITPDDTIHYLSLAYPIKGMTPFVLFSKRNQFFETFGVPRPALPAGQVPPGNHSGLPPAPPLPPANRPPDPPDGNVDIYSSAIGARWNIQQKVALKAQIEKFKVQDDARAIENNISNNGTVFSIVIEGVF